jgi:ectoine hydroxylase-related dioxygenase (phytanoyl-CoA dioxygenase family)
METTINKKQLKSLQKEGYIYIKNFFSSSELNPLITELVSLAIAFGAEEKNVFNFEEIDKVFVKIVQKNPEVQTFLYDRMQLLPQLLKMPSNDKILKLAKTILNTENIGVWPRMQLRLDLTNDTKNLIEWHTDYIYNKGTPNSYTFWLPIVSISESMGPILMVPESHNKEYEFVKTTNERRHSFTLEPKQVKELKTIQINKFDPGDLVVFHSKFLHSGMINQLENRARMVCVFRMQDVNKLDIFLGDKND